MKRFLKRLRTILLLGVLFAAAGSVGGWFAYQSFGESTEWMNERVVEAEVISIQREESRLVVEMETEDEVLLATFNERLGDIERLVSEGARVTLRVPDGQPILDDPTIVMVANAAPVAEEGDDDSLEEERAEMREVRRRARDEARALREERVAERAQERAEEREREARVAARRAEQEEEDPEAPTEEAPAAEDPPVDAPAPAAAAPTEPTDAREAARRREQVLRNGGILPS